MRDPNQIIYRFNQGCLDFERAIGSREMSRISDYEAAVSSAAQRAINALELTMRYYLKSVCGGRVLSPDGTAIERPKFFDLVRGMEHYGDPPLDPEIGSRLLDYRELRNQAEHKATVPPFEVLQNALLETRRIMLIYLDIDDVQLKEVRGLFSTISVTPGGPIKVFIGYKRHSQPDEGLALYLKDQLTRQDHDVFIDQTMRTGEAWLERIDREIRTSDFVVALLSNRSADSEMLRSEINRAYEYRQVQGKPQILPVRIAYQGLLPYAISAFLSPLQYLVWEDKTDNEVVANEILDAMRGHLPERPPIQIDTPSKDSAISEDGRLVAADERPHAPLPEFDPRLIDDLPIPTGAVRLRDKFYVAREADAQFRSEVVKQGSTVTIRAPRQSGKSSLLVRGLHEAGTQGIRKVRLDLQVVSHDDLRSWERFLQFLASFIVYKLGLDEEDLSKSWDSSLAAPSKLTDIMENYVLPASDDSIVLALDEADRLLEKDYSQDFFSLLRSWHNNRADEEEWEKLNLVLVISTEPYLLIPNPEQSPFNVGLPLYLEDFDLEQIEDLNQRHGGPLIEAELEHLRRFLNGQPYLTRKAFYLLATQQVIWTDLVREAGQDQGPFGDHLRSQFWFLQDRKDLRETLKQIVQHKRCSNDDAFYRLLRAGLVKGSVDDCVCRCELYEVYLKERL